MTAVCSPRSALQCNHSWGHLKEAPPPTPYSQWLRGSQLPPFGSPELHLRAELSPNPEMRPGKEAGSCALRSVPDPQVQSISPGALAAAVPPTAPPKQSRATAWFWLQQTSPNRPSNVQQLVVITI